MKTSFFQRPLEHVDALLIVFALLFCTYTYIHQPPTADNQRSRLDLLHALWNEGTIHIDTYHHNTHDLSFYNGHYYSEKAPAITLFALPGFFLAASALEARGIRVDSSVGWLKTDWFATVSSVSLIAALGGVALLAFLLSQKISRRAALVTTLAIFLGAAPLPYSTVLFSHGAATGLIAIALFFLCASSSPRADVYAGLCAGFALASEFTAGTAVVGLCILAMYRAKTFPFRFLVAALFPLLLIPGYNWMAYESPFRFGYMHSEFTQIHERGFFGIEIPPNPIKLFYFLFSPARGLFVWTPFLLLIVPGYRLLRNVTKKNTTFFWIFLCVPLVHVLFLGGYANWGGWALGPRYLATVLPFFALPAAHAAEKFPRTAFALTALSVLLTGMGTVLDPLIPLDFTYPISQFYWPLFLKGSMALNMGQEFGLPGYGSLVPLLILQISLLAILWRRWAKS